MAEADNKAPPPPPPPPPKPPVAPEAHGVTAAKQSTGNKLLRPFKYLWGFVAGGVKGSLDGTAQWASRGMWFGMGMVLLIGLSGGLAGGVSLLYPLLMGGAGGFLAGGVLGAAGGMASGAVSSVRRQHRADVYADDLIVREKAKAKPVITPNYREGLRERQYRNDVLQGLTDAQQRELQQDTTYWRDSVSRGGGGYGRGSW